MRPLRVTGRSGLTAFGCLILGLALGAFAKYLEAPVGPDARVAGGPGPAD